MTANEFEDTLRRYLRAEPFVPFEVELTDGRTIDVDQPTVAFNNGSAVFVADGPDLFDFACEEVRAFRPNRTRAAS